MKPILFNQGMVKAILEGRKTVTRRLVKPQPDSKHQSPLGYCVDSTGNNKDIGKYGFGIDEYGGHIQYVKPPYQVGDILYVRETWKIEEFYDDEALIVFKANGHIELEYENKGEVYKKLYKYADKNGWQPSLFMPKEAARIFLKVTDVRVERLQDITEEQARAEGCIDFHDKIGNGNFDDVLEFDLTARDAFVELWNSTLKKDSSDTWAHNPWVWVYEFERCEKLEG